MSGTSIVPANVQVPAYLQQPKLMELAHQANAIAVGGIGGASFPRISIRGGRFHAVVDGEENTIGNVDPTTGVFQPLTQLSVVIVAGNPNLSKMYYDKGYDPNATDSAPKCYSNNGVTPEPRSEQVQAASCAVCPHNVWGSKITPQGTKTKACADSKRVAILASDDLEGEVYGMNIPAASLKPLRDFVNKLDERGLPITAVKTILSFDASASYPLLNFNFGGFLEVGEFSTVVKRCKEDQVAVITGTANQAPALSGPATPPPAPPVAPAQPVPQAAPVPSVPTVPGFGGAPAPVAAPVPPPAAAPAEAPAGKGFGRGRKKKQPDAPVAQPQPPIMQPPAAPVAPVAPQAAAAPVAPVEQELDALLAGLNFS